MDRFKHYHCSQREVKGKTSQETRYFISRLDANDPKYLAHIIRAGELKITYKDCAFDEERQRNNNSAANMAIIRHMALNLLKAEKTAKVGVKNKRLKAGWNDNDLLNILAG